MIKTNGLTIPDPLKKGETIGFVSPSAGLAPFAMHRILKAKQYFENLGYKVKISNNALKNSGYISSTPERRAEDIHNLFADKKVKAIISTIGGNNSNQLLDKLDYKLILNNPKIFIGYSDITSLHFAIQKKTNLATFYGPCAMTQFGENPLPMKYTNSSFFEAITGAHTKKHKYQPSKNWTDETLNWFEKKDLERPRKKNKNPGYFWLKNGKASGLAWGGCLQTINALVGTEYWIDPKDGIFFLDIPEGHNINTGMPLAEIDFYLNHLKLVGVFKKIQGLIIGKPYKFSKKQTSLLNKIVLSVTKGTNYPILTSANIGHVDPIITLRYGSKLSIDSNNPDFESH